ncbi:uncharacterized protein HMPREF1541_01919 [Cyphellophora europaea CBS 101466]|uniref:Rhodopsin domain-containing protein n=1 Tax=Cyphellophora europaea (strain CBS 101466) TaxID=1220924 RepID=W2S223_CYPE1|nr:uncharacterized protein HMPREF1541_01919 [Cyphellophora europaea CBS 101466]ETN42761.1 hypothetical protein HMPREF1541_01919 [Cyphellophora europaea CBS 101466]
MSIPTSPAFETVRADDRGAPLAVINCILIVFSGIVVLSRAIVRWNITKLNATDDFAIHLALAFVVAQTVLVQLARNRGIGRHRLSLSEDDFRQYSLFAYLSQLLTLCGLFCAKLAVSRLIVAIRPQRTYRRICFVLEIVMLMWLISSIFTVGFQCQLPQPWLLSNDRCIDLVVLHRYVGAMNILTDVVLVVLPAPIVYPLQLERDKKSLVIALFATRIFSVAAEAAYLVYFNHWLEVIDEDQTWEAVDATIVHQVMLNLSLMTACVPSIRRVISELYTGQMGVKVSEQLELTLGGTTVSTTTKVASLSGHKSMSSRSEQRPKDNAAVAHMPYGHNVPRIGNIARIYSERSRSRPGLTKTSSEEHLRAEGIMRTIEVSVEDGRSTPSVSGDMRRRP